MSAADKPHDLTSRPRTSPASIYRYRDGIHAVELLIVAITELDLFSHLTAGPLDLRQLCERLSIHERPADVMATLLVAMGYLERQGEAVGLTETAREHLVESSPWYLGPYYSSLRGRPVVRSMLEVLRTGKPAGWGGDKEWAEGMEDEDFADAFTREMDCRGVTLGPALAEKLRCQAHVRLLDVGGGSGVYACAVVAAHPHMKATVLEKPPVDRIARQSIEQKGFAGRVSVLAADMFVDDWPTDCDVHLLSNVVHDWGEARVRRLFEASYRALRPGGFIAIHDAHLDAAKTGPLAVAEYSALLMHFTEGKCYSVAEIDGLLGDAGFVAPEFAPTVAERSLITARKR